MNGETKECLTCVYVYEELDEHGFRDYYCRRYPGLLYLGNARACFNPMPEWTTVGCGEFERRD